MEKITFDVSALEETNSNLVKDFEVRFSEPINADWLVVAIEKALEKYYSEKALLSEPFNKIDIEE